MNAKDKNILVVFGTRPEAIKLAPVIKALEEKKDLKVFTCVLRQQKELLNDPLKVFNIKPSFDIDLPFGNHGVLGNGNIFKKGWSAVKVGFGLLRFILILKRKNIHLVVVQGDTSTVFLAAFLAFHFKIPVAHVEAGLRSGDKHSPFPEEINRMLTCSLAELHFASTESAKQNLLKENVSESKIWMTGNTVLDAIRIVTDLQKDGGSKERLLSLFKEKYGIILDKPEQKIVLITAHRRESFGEGMKNISDAIAELAQKLPNAIFVYPVHPNPNVRDVVYPRLEGIKTVHLIEPLGYEAFSFLMGQADIILTDSGGVQEEVSFIGKPTLVMREVTERPEGLDSGNAILVGTDKNKIINETLRLLEDKSAYDMMAKKHTAFGDGHASERIADAIQNYFK